jgi:hypothetical protein
MKRMQCDVCTKQTEDLATLLELHQTKDIKHVCRDCEKVLNEHKSKLQAVTSKMVLDWFRSYLANMRNRFTQKGSQP